MSPIKSHSLNLSDAITSDRCNCLIAVTSYKTKRDCLTKGLTEKGGGAFWENGRGEREKGRGMASTYTNLQVASILTSSTTLLACRR